MFHENKDVYSVINKNYVMLSLLKIGIECACVSLSLFICFLAYVPTLLNRNFNNCPGIFSTFFFFQEISDQCFFFKYFFVVFLDVTLLSIYTLFMYATITRDENVCVV